MSDIMQTHTTGGAASLQIALDSTPPRSAVFWGYLNKSIHTLSATKREFQLEINRASDVIEMSPRGTKRRRLIGASWEETLEREAPGLAGAEQKENLLALRTLVEQVRFVLCGTMPGGLIKINNAQQISLIADLEDDLFENLQLLRPEAGIPRERKALIQFLSTKSGSVFQEASKAAHTVTVQRVYDAAIALKREEAATWLNILRNGNPVRDQDQKTIHELVSELDMEKTEFRRKMAVGIKEATQKLRRSYYDELKEEFRLDISTEVDAKVKRAVAEAERGTDAKLKKVRRAVAEVERETDNKVRRAVAEVEQATDAKVARAIADASQKMMEKMMDSLSEQFLRRNSV